MGVSTTPYWTETGKFLLKREGVWGVVNCWGGDLQSLQVKCAYDITFVWHSGDEPGSAS